jgi:hypothetical protein
MVSRTKLRNESRPGTQTASTTSASTSTHRPFARWQPGFGMESGSVDTQLSSAFSLHKRWPSSPTSTTTLNDNHISEALLKSEDNGATLDFSHRGLTDLDEYSATQLAAVGREDPVEDESSVLRCACPSPTYTSQTWTFQQSYIGLEPSSHAARDIRSPISSSLSQLEKQLPFCVPQRCEHHFFHLTNFRPTIDTVCYQAHCHAFA